MKWQFINFNNELLKRYWTVRFKEFRFGRLRIRIGNRDFYNSLKSRKFIIRGRQYFQIGYKYCVAVAWRKS
jgi:hypothetical protein